MTRDEAKMEIGTRVERLVYVAQQAGLSLDEIIKELEYQIQTMKENPADWA